MITSNSKDIKNAINDIQTYIKGLNRSLLSVGQIINASIKTRSQKGIGLEGRMPAYSKKYKAWKKGKGRDVGHRDLTFSGRMWSSLTEEVLGKGESIRMFFGGKEEQLKAQGNTEIAPFFGMTKTENKIYNDFTSDILRSIHL